MIKFKEEYKTGIAVIDEQHKEFFLIVNRLEVAIVKQDLSLMLSILDEFTKYTKYHFITEEVFLSDLEPHLFKRHKEIHDKIKKDVLELKTNIENSSDPLPLFVDLYDILKGWIIDHVLHEDCIIKEISHRY
ncbi:MAG: bacteriohemerythrin [Proteocatella sp.]